MTDMRDKVFGMGRCPSCGCEVPCLSGGFVSGHAIGCPAITPVFKTVDTEEMKEEYDFSNGVRGKPTEAVKEIRKNKNRLVWTKELPTTDGWYWVKRGDSPFRPTGSPPVICIEYITMTKNFSGKSAYEDIPYQDRPPEPCVCHIGDPSCLSTKDGYEYSGPIEEPVNE